MSDGWNPVTERLRKDLERLEEELQTLIFIPKMKKKILFFLKENPDSTEKAMKEILAMPELNIYLLWVSFYYAWKALMLERQIVGTSHGKGHSRTWRVSEDS